MTRRKVVTDEKVNKTILLIRDKQVMLDIDLAAIFGTTTKRLNQQVKRNLDRFPADFMFQLTHEEKEEVVTNCDHLRQLKFSTTSPFAFTEHGAIMVATILNTQQAVESSVAIVRAFVKYRKVMLNNKELAKKLSVIEASYDKRFKAVFNSIRKLMHLPSNHIKANKTRLKKLRK